MTDNRCVTSQEQKIELDFWRNAMRLNTSIPAIINSFDPVTQTVSATPGIKAKYVSPDEKSEVQYLSYPMITNIPLAIQRGAGLRITYPITPGNPCTLIFSQRSIDNFVLEGTEANPVDGPNPKTAAIRCMDLTDAMCFPGIITTKDTVSDYATDAIEIRSDDNKVKVSLKQDSLTLKQDSATIELKGGNIKMNGTTVTINGYNFMTHQHTGVTSGGSKTGGVG